MKFVWRWIVWTFIKYGIVFLLRNGQEQIMSIHVEMWFQTMNIIFITKDIKSNIDIRLFLYKYYNILCLLLNVYWVIELFFKSLLFSFYTHILKYGIVFLLRNGQEQIMSIHVEMWFLRNRWFEGASERRC
jgi:hypothetical protein